MDVMTVKEATAASEKVHEAERGLRAMEDLLELVRAQPGITAAEVARRFDVDAEAVAVFASTAHELLGDRPLSVATARRAAVLAVAEEVWEGELGPLLSSAQVRELLGGVSRQRVDELLRSHRLIGLADSGGRRRFPGFQFVDGRPQAPLIDAFWTLSDSAVEGWTAASWCVATDDALDGLSPALWAREGRDPERLRRVAVQDAARLAQ
jgi:hypothetical protein